MLMSIASLPVAGAQQTSRASAPITRVVIDADRARDTISRHRNA